MSQNMIETILLWLYRHQEGPQTRLLNGVGFNKYDAGIGYYLGEWIDKGRHLTGKYLQIGERLARKYSRQYYKYNAL